MNWSDVLAGAALSSLTTPHHNPLGFVSNIEFERSWKRELYQGDKVNKPLRARVPLKVSESIRRVRNTMTKRITLPYFVSSRTNEPSNPIVTVSGSESSPFIVPQRRNESKLEKVSYQMNNPSIPIVSTGHERIDEHESITL